MTVMRAGAMKAAMATMWAMVTATKLAGKEEGKGKGGKGTCNGNGNVGGRHQRG